jgi:hypothetical protein
MLHPPLDSLRRPRQREPHSRWGRGRYAAMQSRSVLPDKVEAVYVCCRLDGRLTVADVHNAKSPRRQRDAGSVLGRGIMPRLGLRPH